jgi:hypothetical protein
LLGLDAHERADKQNETKRCHEIAHCPTDAAAAQTARSIDRKGLLGGFLGTSA